MTHLRAEHSPTSVRAADTRSSCKPLPPLAKGHEGLLLPPGGQHSEWGSLGLARL